MTGRNDDDLWSAGLNLTSSNTSPKSHSATPATSRQSAASTKMRSELPLKAAHHNCLMAAHCYRRTDIAKEDRNYTGTTAHRSLPNLWSVYEYNRPDIVQPLPHLWSVASWHPPPFWQSFKADHTDSRIAMDWADRNRESPQLGDWWDKLTTTIYNLRWLLDLLNLFTWSQ